MKIFINDELAYLEWVNAHKNTGFILNVDKTRYTNNYPKLHIAQYQCVTSSKKTNYTNNQYIKVCSESRTELEAWSKKKYDKEITRCGVCFRSEIKRN